MKDGRRVTRLLLFEFIHADESAYVAAPQGLRTEGRAMLETLASDAAEAQGVVPTVLLCESAIADVCEIPQAVDVLVPDRFGPLIEQLPELSGGFDAVLPIVPECDQLLRRVVKRLASTSLNTLLPSEELVAFCSDKLMTWMIFRDVGIPMLECMQTSSFDASVKYRDGCVIKDRWGAGCEGIRRGRPGGEDAAASICQRWIDAVSLSVGVIGNGTETKVLPIACQQIHWVGDQPEYHGGHIPAAVEVVTTQQVDVITQQVLDFAGGFAGYMGIDFLVETSTGIVYLNEINPRLCTSYIGYRRLLHENAVELMLGIAPLDTASVRMGRVSFDKSGATIADMG